MKLKKNSNKPQQKMTVYHTKDVIRNGLIAWFDVIDHNLLTRTKWKSKVNGFELSPTSVSRQRGLKPYNQRIITLRKSPNLGINGVYFDYEHTMKFNKTINSLQTIISIHSYENEMGSKHENVHGAPGHLNNFYI